MDKESEDKNTLTEKLEKILSLVNEWLKYSDQKLAGLTVLNAGILWGYSRYINKFDQTMCITKSLNFIGYLLIIVSIFTCILGMLPVLSKLWIFNKNKFDSDNILFFADIQKYQRRDYLALLCKKLDLEVTRYSPYVSDLAAQIITNSEITTVKFQRIKFASWLTIIGSSAFITSFLITYIQG